MKKQGEGKLKKVTGHYIGVQNFVRVSETWRAQ